ncbi:MAG TPA: hypothetical protein VF575_04985 [Candidatus Saccharimonadales bacterium]
MLAFYIFVSVLVGATPVSAHELQQDKGVSAVLHIPPDDNPYAERETFLNFNFTSQNGRFDLRRCDCVVTAQDGINRPITSPLYSTDKSAIKGYAGINFPAAGVYEVDVQGFAAGYAGERFKLAYQLRVVSPSASDESSSDLGSGWQVIMLSLTALLLLGIVANELIKRGGRYGKRT